MYLKICPNICPKKVFHYLPPVFAFNSYFAFLSITSLENKTNFNVSNFWYNCTDFSELLSRQSRQPSLRAPAYLWLAMSGSHRSHRFWHLLMSVQFNRCDCDAFVGWQLISAHLTIELALNNRLENRQIFLFCSDRPKCLEMWLHF